MNKRMTIALAAAIALLVASGVVGTVIAVSSTGGSPVPVAATPPDWAQSIVSAQVQRCGSPDVQSAAWVLTNYAAGESVLDQQAGPSDQNEYLVVLTAATEFVNNNGFDPVDAQPSHGKYIELLINADTHVVDTFGIGNDIISLDGLGQVYSYSVK